MLLIKLCVETIHIQIMRNYLNTNDTPKQKWSLRYKLESTGLPLPPLRRVVQMNCDAKQLAKLRDNKEDKTLFPKRERAADRQKKS